MKQTKVDYVLDQYSVHIRYTNNITIHITEMNCSLHYIPTENEMVHKQGWCTCHVYSVTVYHG